MSEQIVKSNELPTDEYVWLGDLSGFQVHPSNLSHTYLYHRCGWERQLIGPDQFLANTILFAMEHRKEGCK